ncbi:MAG: hypothetical protein ACON4U_13775 [Myxococcota bacterium]
MITLHSHPSLYLLAFRCRFPKMIGDYSDTELLPIRQYFQNNTNHHLPKIDTKQQIRDMLRTGGFQPSGRNKPAHEYLTKAIEKGWFTPHKGINAAVDCCNVVSLHSGLPISVVDADNLVVPLELRICPNGCTYSFNPSGQMIKAQGLIALWDQIGPSATPVKDSQRTKTSDQTVKTLSIIWGHQDFKSHTEAALEWYQNLLQSLGAELWNEKVTQTSE